MYLQQLHQIYIGNLPAFPYYALLHASHIFLPHSMLSFIVYLLLLLAFVRCACVLLLKSIWSSNM